MRSKGFWKFAEALLVSLPATLCGCHAVPSARPTGRPVAITVPTGLPPVHLRSEDQPTAQSIALGRRLFYDKRLSGDNSIACASCHRPELGFKDSQPLSVGVGGTRGRRHAPTIVNAVYTPYLFWDGRSGSLEDQVDGPISDPREMGQTHQVLISRLQSDPRYRALFREAFGSDEVTFERAAVALASFERTILSGDSAFDRYEYEGRKDALSAAQVRGLAIFTDPKKGNCSACHALGAKNALFTDGEFHNTGEGVGGDGELTDQGRFEVTKRDADRGAFKTPTLRDVAVSGPYMHDGKLKTLRDVVDFYAGGGNSNPYLDKRITALPLSGRDRDDLVEFMKALTGVPPSNVGPPGEDGHQ